MRAAVYDEYGLPDVVRVEELPEPEPGEGQVVVEVAATSINLSDWECLRGRPLYARIGGLRTPAQRTLGSDIAGRVAAVGLGVTGFAVGDEVYGDNLALKGGFAEFAVAPASALAHKPEALSFVQASALPQAAAIATQGTTRVQSGQRVLINGAGGGSGSFAIQLAKQAGAHVTGVDNARKLDFMRSLGADEAVDYEQEDFSRLPSFDHVLDLVAHRSVFAYRRALAPRGRYRCVGGSVPTLLRVLTVGALVGALSGRSIGVLEVKEGPEHFQPLAEQCAAGAVQIHIDRTFGLDDIAAALTHVGAGRALGKVVVCPR
ncbi:NAD(P)-dependent alcohol dehydrogenase [Ornithinimicrobium ciconiae]|uniref:NAD(P)-dependent alcohol dehydrogenase n=1 Tax=Ornithinimicrobium ciconiae TaxID=2594265 RepID=A0A516GD81_9MICO|nr:NAD(P)-dependent alcohol dehydrogenase [Ornithinimicrobium ciconiae]QDO89483.1 NAD(P)-dependent alcohol dehydrogenase [Ornithinimicrobium ciconiae]